ncbi:MAG: 30S ribosomal protein S8, partial [Nanoarchaeota archaeon]|nr:30S ribosomal protein S8 [Nanoarchaeota archaeon]
TNDTLANALSKVLNAEKKGKFICIIRPSSKFNKNVLDIMHDNNYIGSLKVVEDGKGGYIEINLLGNINNCGVIKPRFSVKYDEFEKFEKRFLPAKNFGILLVSTPKGLMTHTEAQKNKLGGRVISYCY